MINFTGQKPERTGIDMNENKIKEFVGRLSDEQKKKDRQTASGVTGTIKNTVATGPAIQVPHVATGAGINVKK